MSQVAATETNLKTWTVYRAIRGAKLVRNDEIELGKFRVLKNSLIVKNNIQKICNPETFQHDVEKYFLPDKCGVFLSTQVNASSGKESLEIADSEFRKFDNIIRYMISSFDSSMDAGVFNYYAAELSKAICISHPEYFLSSSAKGSIIPIHLDGEFMCEHRIDSELFKETFSGHYFFKNPSLGFDWVWKTVSKENLTNLERRIISAIEWLGKSVKDNSLSRAYIQVVFALETLFVHQEKKVLVSPGIASQLAEFSAFIVGSDYESRCTTEKLVKEIYSKRSAIVHGGDSEVSKDQYKRAFSLLQKLILKLTTTPSLQLSSMEKLSEWVKKKKYAD